MKRSRTRKSKSQSRDPVTRHGCMNEHHLLGDIDSDFKNKNGKKAKSESMEGISSAKATRTEGDQQLWFERCRSILMSCIAADADQVVADCVASWPVQAGRDFGDWGNWMMSEAPHEDRCPVLIIPHRIRRCIILPQDVLLVAKDWQLEDFAGVFTLDSTSQDRIAELLYSMKPSDVAKVCESWNPDGEILQVGPEGSEKCDEQVMALVTDQSGTCKPSGAPFVEDQDCPEGPGKAVFFISRPVLEQLGVQGGKKAISSVMHLHQVLIFTL